MGPCRIDPFGEGPQLGACGADAHLIVARNLARAVAAGSALPTATTAARWSRCCATRPRPASRAGYALANEQKLRALAAEWEIAGRRAARCARSRSTWRAR